MASQLDCVPSLFAAILDASHFWFQPMAEQHCANRLQTKGEVTVEKAELASQIPIGWHQESEPIENNSSKAVGQTVGGPKVKTLFYIVIKTLFYIVISELCTVHCTNYSLFNIASLDVFAYVFVCENVYFLSMHSYWIALLGLVSCEGVPVYINCYVPLLNAG